VRYSCLARLYLCVNETRSAVRPYRRGSYMPCFILHVPISSSSSLPRACLLPLLGGIVEVVGPSALCADNVATGGNGPDRGDRRDQAQESKLLAVCLMHSYSHALSISEA